MPVSRMLAAQAPHLVRPVDAVPVIGDPARARAKARARRSRAAGVAWLAPRSRRGATAWAVGLATGFSLALAAPVDAASGYCSPSGDYCTSATKHSGVRELIISTFSFRGDVDICVEAPGGEDPVCKTRTLKAGKGKAADLYTASIKWSANYPRTPKGLRKVTFQYDDTKLGPTLTFQAG